MNGRSTPDDSAQPVSVNKNTTAYKAALSILFGLLGFGVNFFSIKFAFPPYTALVLIGLLFPMLITLAWGWKYGLLSALAGGCQSMWWLWGPSNGYATFLVVPPFTLWIVWHGFVAGWCKKQTAHPWWLSAYVVEIPFRILSTINLYTLSRWAITLNPPPWSWASEASNTIPMHFSNFVVIKQAAVGYVILLLADVLLHLGFVRKFFRLEEKENQTNTNYIISASLLIGIFVWFVDSVIGYLVFHTEDSFLDLLALNIHPHDVFMRTMFILACLMGGLLTSYLLRRQRESGQALLESEEHYRSLFDSVPVQLMETDLSDVKKYIDELREQGITDLRKYFDEYPEAVQDCAALVRFMDINQAALDVSEMANKADFLENYDFGSETQSLTMFEEELIAFAGGASVHEIEMPFLSPSGKMRYDIKRVSIPPAFAETWSRAVVSFTDITERMQAEESLLASETRYRLLFERSLASVYLTTLDGQVLDCNAAFAHLLGYDSREGLLMHRATEFYFEETDRDTFIAQLKRHGTLTNLEILLRRKDGTPVWVLEEVVLIEEEGVPARIQGTAIDITELKKIESKLKKNENMLRQIIDTSPNCIFVKDRNGMYLMMNKRMAELYSTTSEDLVGKYDYEIAQQWFETVDYNEFRKAEQDVIDNKKTLFINKEPFVYQDGTERWFQTTKLPFELEDNQNGLLVISSDITEQVRAEESLRESEEQFRMMYESLNVGIARVSLDYQIEQANQAYCQMLGYTEDELVGKTLQEITYSEDIPENIEKQAKLGRGEIDSYQMAKRFIHKEGHTVWGLLNANLLCDDEGRPWYFLGNVVDITERVKAGESLRESEEKFRDTVNLLPQVVYEIDIYGNLTFVNKQAFVSFGYSQEDYEKGFNILQTLIPEDRDRAKENIQNKLYGKDIGNPEYTGLRKDGSTFPNLIYSSAIFRDGKPVGLRGIIVDITERVQAEAALQESERQLQTLIDAMPDFVCFKDGDGRWLKANDASIRIFRLEGIDYRGKKDSELAELNSHLRGTFLTCKETDARAWKEVALLRGEETIPRPDGSVRVYDVIKVPVFYPCGGRKGLVVLGHDITERKRAEEESRHSKELLRTVLDIVPTFICAKNLNGMFILVNKKLTDFYGTTVDEMTGLLHADICEDEKELQAMLAADREVIESGKLKLIPEETMENPDGSITVLETYKIPFSAHDEPAVLIAAIDITERKQAQESLKQSTDELTRLYRASGALLASASPDLDSLAQTIVETILLEFEHTNCSLLLVRPDSQELNRLAVAGPYAGEVSKGKLRLDGSGVVPRAIRSGEIINLPDVTVSPDYVPNWDAARSELAVPLKIDQRVIGVIDVQSVKPGAFNTNDERLMFTFAERAALALENARLFSEANRRLKRLGALHTIDKAISTSFDINMTVGVFLEQSLTYLEVDAADVLLFDPFLQTLECVGRKGFRTSALQYTHLRLGQGLAGQVALKREIKYIPDLQEDEEVFLASPDLSGEEFSTYYGIPLIAKGALKGVLEIFHRAPLSSDNEWLMFLNALAGQAAIAIDNASMFTDLQRSSLELGLAYDSTLEGWARALELRDMETEGHSRRVTEMTMRLARAMGISGEALAHIRRGSLLHDIGKMAIPDNILQKPGKLTNDEWNIMRQHPVYARDMLAPIDYLRRAMDIPYSHHEKWDGSGYPQGLRGEEIPLAARIFAVIDVWDALNSDRPYRDAWPEKKVREYIREQNGGHFDPQVVETFLELIDSQ